MDAAATRLSAALEHGSGGAGRCGHVISEEVYYVGLSRGSAHHGSRNPRMSARQLRWMQLLMISSFSVVNWARRPCRSLVTSSEEPYLDQMVRTKRKKTAPIAAPGDGRVNHLKRPTTVDLSAPEPDGAALVGPRAPVA